MYPTRLRFPCAVHASFRGHELRGSFRLPAMLVFSVTTAPAPVSPPLRDISARPAARRPGSIARNTRAFPIDEPHIFSRHPQHVATCFRVLNVPCDRHRSSLCRRSIRHRARKVRSLPCNWNGQRYTAQKSCSPVKVPIRVPLFATGRSRNSSYSQIRIQLIAIGRRFVPGVDHVTFSVSQPESRSIPSVRRRRRSYPSSPLSTTPAICAIELSSTLTGFEFHHRRAHTRPCNIPEPARPVYKRTPR